MAYYSTVWLTYMSYSIEKSHVFLMVGLTKGPSETAPLAPVSEYMKQIYNMENKYVQHELV